MQNQPPDVSQTNTIMSRAHTKMNLNSLEELAGNSDIYYSYGIIIEMVLFK